MVKFEVGTHNGKWCVFHSRKGMGAEIWFSGTKTECDRRVIIAAGGAHLVGVWQ